MIGGCGGSERAGSVPSSPIEDDPQNGNPSTERSGGGGSRPLLPQRTLNLEKRTKNSAKHSVAQPRRNSVDDMPVAWTTGAAAAPKTATPALVSFARAPPAVTPSNPDTMLGSSQLVAAPIQALIRTEVAILRRPAISSSPETAALAVTTRASRTGPAPSSTRRLPASAPHEAPLSVVRGHADPGPAAGASGSTGIRDGDTGSVQTPAVPTATGNSQSVSSSALNSRPGATTPVDVPAGSAVNAAIPARPSAPTSQVGASGVTTRVSIVPQPPVAPPVASSRALDANRDRSFPTSSGGSDGQGARAAPPASSSAPQSAAISQDDVTVGVRVTGAVSPATPAGVSQTRAAAPTVTGAGGVPPVVPTVTGNSQSVSSSALNSRPGATTPVDMPAGSAVNAAIPARPPAPTAQAGASGVTTRVSIAPQPPVAPPVASSRALDANRHRLFPTRSGGSDGQVVRPQPIAHSSPPQLPSIPQEDVTVGARITVAVPPATPAGVSQTRTAASTVTGGGGMPPVRPTVYGNVGGASVRTVQPSVGGGSVLVAAPRTSAPAHPQRADLFAIYGVQSTGHPLRRATDTAEMYEWGMDGGPPHGRTNAAAVNGGNVVVSDTAPMYAGGIHSDGNGGYIIERGGVVETVQTGRGGSAPNGPTAAGAPANGLTGIAPIAAPPPTTVYSRNDDYYDFSSAPIDPARVPNGAGPPEIAGVHDPGVLLPELDDEIRSQNYDKIFVIPDVHGDLVMFVRTLWLALVNVEGRHDIISEADLSLLLQGQLIVNPPPLPISTSRRVAVVQLGDLMDRGPKSIECFRVMQNVARVFGWKTASLYGNHEVMNMNGEYYGFIRDDDVGGYPNLEARKNAVKPGGEIHQQLVGSYLGMVRLVGPVSDTMGNTNTLFVHGGVTMQWLHDERLLVDGSRGGALVRRVNAYFREFASTPRGVYHLETDRTNPVWTRRLTNVTSGFVGCGQELAELLEIFEVSRIIVGHTPQGDYTNKQLCDGKIILADVKMSGWIDWRKGSSDLIVEGHPALILMSMDSEHRLDAIVPHTVIPATGVHGVSLPLVPIHETTGAPTSVCSVADLQTLGDSRLINAMIHLPDDLSTSQRLEALRLSHTPEASRPCLRHLISARRRDMRGACSDNQPNSRSYIMCDFRESIRLAAMSTMGVPSTGACGSIQDRARLMDLDIARLAEVGSATITFLHRIERQVSADCGRCLRTWADLGHCRNLPSVSENETIFKISCARLDRFAGTAHCLVPSNIPP